MSGLLDKLIQTNLGDLWPFLLGVFKDPASEPKAFAAMLGAFAIVVLLIVLVLVLIFMAIPDEEDEYEELEGAEVPAEPAPEIASLEEGEALPPVEPRWRPSPLVAGTLWALVFALVWVAGGVVSSRDVMCESCHGDKPFHAARESKRKIDPHAQVSCVECHESPSVMVRLTVAVPTRAVHFIGGVTWPEISKGYGTPVTNKSCAACHEKVLSTTFTNVVRGVRVSHVEPLEAKALCGDCHATHPNGVTDRYTVGMAPCMRCHNDVKASAKCEYCHTKDVGYAVASRGVVSPRTHGIEWNCGSCHTDQTRCDNCHGIRMPHGQAFMHGGHARVAAEDIWFNNGQMCARCHAGERRPCGGCHAGNMPSHGSPSWARDHQAADPLDNGCDGCHSYLAWINGRNFCVNCHPAILAPKGGAKK